MTIVVTGGGSGGHITPILAVASELKRLQPDTRIVYIGQKGDNLGDIPARSSHIDETFAIRAGKFRRYNGEGLLRQLLDLPTMYKNTRDAVYTLIGYWQSRRLLKQLRPEVVFVKGGFVGVPVGLAAASLHIPYVTHDSDAIPGLANRIIARWASLHAVALPKEVYGYPAAKTVTTGIPLQANFKPVTKELQRSFKKEIDVPEQAKLLFIIGGGLGSQRVNAAVAEAVPHLLKEFPDLYVVHIAGRHNETDLQATYNQSVTEAEQGRVRVFGYLDDVYRYSGAADVIITRAGATNLAEFALQGKACIVVPSPFLTGGHQLKNAAYLEEKGAAAVINEVDVRDDPNRLARQVSELFQRPAEIAELAKHLSEFAQPDAAAKLAHVLLEHAKS